MPGHIGSPGPPHDTQPLLKHVSPLALHVLPAQHCRPCPPQLLHSPSISQTSPRRHVVPVLMHMRGDAKWSQQPVEHMLPGQHGWPTMPHVWHWLFEPHTSPPPHGVLDGQHG